MEIKYYFKDEIVGNNFDERGTQLWHKADGPMGTFDALYEHIIRSESPEVAGIKIKPVGLRNHVKMFYCGKVKNLGEWSHDPSQFGRDRFPLLRLNEDNKNRLLALRDNYKLDPTTKVYVRDNSSCIAKRFVRVVGENEIILPGLPWVVHPNKDKLKTLLEGKLFR